MAQFLNKGDHIFIPFCNNGKNMIGDYGSLCVYKSLKTAMRYRGKDADEVVEYAPIVRCGKCRHFVPNKADEPDFCGGTGLYNDGCYVDTDDFCSQGEARRGTEVKGDGQTD